jgi:hypothetical protein
LDLGEKGPLVVGDLETLTRLHAQDTRQMSRLIATQFGDAAVNFAYKESPPCQVNIVTSAVSGDLEFSRFVDLRGIGLNGFRQVAQERLSPPFVNPQRGEVDLFVVDTEAHPAIVLSRG